MALPKDTSAAAFAVQLDRLRAMRPQERLRLAAEMSDELREVAEAGIRSRHPGSSDREVGLALETLLLGEELAMAARQSRLAPSR